MLRVPPPPRPWLPVLILLAMSLAADVRAQQEAKGGATEQSAPRATETMRKIQEIQKSQIDKGRRDISDRLAGDPAAPLPPPDAASSDQPTREAYLAATREYYRYRISGFQHRQEVFAWQHWSSKVIFAVVLVLVGAGIYFAAIQFHRGLKRTDTAPQSEDGQITEFVASFKGIKVSSPVLGVIILVISLVFFYLYLAFVYPIREVF